MQNLHTLKKAFALFGIEFNGENFIYKCNGKEISNDAAWKIILDIYNGGWLPVVP